MEKGIGRYTIAKKWNAGRITEVTYKTEQGKPLHKYVSLIAKQLYNSERYIYLYLFNSNVLNLKLTRIPRKTESISLLNVYKCVQSASIYNSKITEDLYFNKPR